MLRGGKLLARGRVREFEVTPDHWWGSRDRSWGVRPVGEPEPPGIRGTESPEGFFWLYVPMQFPGFSLFLSAQERQDGSRVLEEATLSLLTDRRRHAPPGLNGGGPGRPGRNLLNGEQLPAKATRALAAGDVVTVETPGGGGWGRIGA